MRYVLDLDERHDMALRRFVRDRRGGMVPADDLSELSSGDDTREVAAEQAPFLRRHRTLVIFLALGVLSLAVFTWGEWRYFIDNSFEHHSAPPGFWSSSHFHDWLYNAASNWQSEILMGAFLVYLVTKHAPSADQESDD